LLESGLNVEGYRIKATSIETVQTMQDVKLGDILGKKEGIFERENSQA
jgi:hypothetical protein